jgi:hypothetical protein
LYIVSASISASTVGVSKLVQTTSWLALPVGKVTFSVKWFLISTLLPSIFSGAMHPASHYNHQTINTSTNSRLLKQACFSFQTPHSKQTQVLASSGSQVHRRKKIEAAMVQLSNRPLFCLGIGIHQCDLKDKQRKLIQAAHPLK